MLTLEKLKIFDNCGGDVDFFDRSGSKKQKDLMNDGYEFGRIDKLMSDIHIVQQGLVSPEYKAVHEKELLELCPDTKVLEALIEMVKRYRKQPLH